ELVVAPAAPDGTLRAETGRVDLEDGARVVVEPAHEARCNFVPDAQPRQRALHRLEVLGALGTEGIQHARRSGDHGRAGGNLAIQDSQRIRREALLAVAAELPLVLLEIRADGFAIGRPAGRVAERVEE